MAETKWMTRDEVLELVNSANGTCISIYIPTHRKGIEATQGSIHLKNLLTEVEAALAEKGHRWDEVEALTGEARRLIGDTDFWQHQGEGLAIFLTSGFSKVYQLPISVPNRQTVSDTFEVTPLMPMLSGDGHFYILAVSANDVRLLDATRFTFEEVCIDGVPRAMSEALHADDHERELQFHSGAGPSPSGSGRSAMYFGTGDEGNLEQKKTDFKRYFDKVDAGLAPLFKKSPAPCVLAGVGYLLPIYRKANTSANLLEGEVHGNQDRSTAEEIHQASWDLAAPHFEKVQETAVERFRELLGTGLASSSETEISEAAVAGRVETLFISQEVPDELRQPVNATAVQTMVTGGQILALAPGAMPAEQAMVATFRY